MATSKKADAKGVKDIFCTEIITENSITSAPPDMHSHEFIELIFAEKASTSIWVGGEPYRLSNGDLVLISPGILHTRTFFDKGHYYSITISPRMLFSSDQALSGYKYFIPFLSPDSHKKLYSKLDLERTDIHDMIKETMREWASKQPGYELIVRANVFKIFTALYRCNDQSVVNIQSNSTNVAINSALSYISSNFATVTEQQAADHCGLSLAYFSTLFKNTVGLKFGEYVMRTRIDRAKHLLLTTNRSITYIAYETGFSSASHFISRFKEFENTTPAYFRRQIQSGGSTPKKSTPSFTVYFSGDKRPSGQLLVFKYRTNRKQTPPWMAIFLGTTSNYPREDDLSWAYLTCDERWHVIVIDMAQATQLVKTFLPGTDGKYYSNFVAIHPFYGDKIPTEYMDFAYVGYAEDVESAKRMIGGNEDVAYGYFTTREGEHWITYPFYSEGDKAMTVVSPSHHYADGRAIYENVINSGQSIRKIELLDNANFKYTRVWSI